MSFEKRFFNYFASAWLVVMYSAALTAAWCVWWPERQSATPPALSGLAVVAVVLLNYLIVWVDDAAKARKKVWAAAVTAAVSFLGTAVGAYFLAPIFAWWIYAHHPAIRNLFVGPFYLVMALAAFGALAAPGLLSLALAMAVIGVAGPPDTRARHLGALRPGETYVSGARVELAQKNVRLAPGQLSIGGVPIPLDREPQGQLLFGAPGTGKTQAIDGYLRAIRARASRARAVIIDPFGGYYSKFGRPGIDVLVNPLDAQDAGWSPFAEFTRPQDFPRLGAAFVPDIEGPNAEWPGHSRSVLTDIQSSMHARGEKDIKKLVRLITADPEFLTDYLVGAGFPGWASPDGRKMMTSAKQGLNDVARIFRLLRPDGNFSVREWVKNGDGKDGWLFITYRQDQMAALKQFVVAMADIAMLETMSLDPTDHLPHDHQRRLFFVMDEMDQVGKSTQVLDLLTRGRKFGGCFLGGVQTHPQLELVYGPTTVKVLMGSSAIKAIFRVQDPNSAQAMARLLGETVVDRLIVSTSVGKSESTTLSERSAGSDSRNVSRSQSIQTITRPVIHYSDLMNLPDLSGVLMQPASAHLLFKLAVVKMNEINAPFRPREAI